MGANKTLLAVVSLVVLITLGGVFLKNNLSSKSVQGATTYQVRPEWTEVDIQNGVKVLASYLPEQSDASRFAVLVDISSESFDLSGYDVEKKAILANDQLEALPAGIGEYLERSQRKIVVKMTYGRVSDTHYHLLIKDLAGISDRVLHYYF